MGKQQRLGRLICRWGLWGVLVLLCFPAGPPVTFVHSAEPPSGPGELAGVGQSGSESAGPPQDSSGDGSSAWLWQKSDGSVALLDGEAVVWRLNYEPPLDMPFFHPLTAGDGRVLTWNQPTDHTWHHGLWFSWKYINGVNYWEQNRETGRPDGRTRWSDVKVATRDDGSATITMSLSYQAADDDEAVLGERRHIRVSPPGDDDCYRVDWLSVFTALKDATLDRTPPQPQSSGGYAGLSVRFAENLENREARSLAGLVTFDGGNRYRGKSGAMDYSGVIEGVPVGLAFLDHPGNPRHPTPWYLIRSPQMSYINAALLNDAAYVLGKGQQLTLRYRLVVHPDRWDSERLGTAQEEFANSSLPSSED